MSNKLLTILRFIFVAIIVPKINLF